MRHQTRMIIMEMTTLTERSAIDVTLPTVCKAGVQFMDPSSERFAVGTPSDMLAVKNTVY